MAGLIPQPPSHIHSTTRLTHLEAHSFLSDFLARADVDAAYRPDSTLSERGPIALSGGGGANPNLTLHHLKRILAGMEGKRISGKLVVEGMEEEGAGQEETEIDGITSSSLPEAKTNGKNNRRSYADGDDTERLSPSKQRKIYESQDPADPDAEDSDGPALVGEGGDSEDWQPKSTYELSQTTQGLELTNEDRHPGADLEQPADASEEEEMVELTIRETGEKVDPRTQYVGGDYNAPAINKTKQKENTLRKEQRKRLKKQRNKDEKSHREESRKKDKEKTRK